MAREFTLAIVAPDRAVVEQPVIAVGAPGLEGYFGVLAGHVPFVAALKPGLVEYQDTSGARHYISVSGGFAEVSGDRMTILADAAERASDIDIARAERALEEARDRLRGGGGGTTSEEAVQEVDRAINRLRAAQKA